MLAPIVCGFAKASLAKSIGEQALLGERSMTGRPEPRFGLHIALVDEGGVAKEMREKVS